jgi:hypothetical protein
MTGWLCFFAWIFSLGAETPVVVSMLTFLAWVNEIL